MSSPFQFNKKTRRNYKKRAERAATLGAALRERKPQSEDFFVRMAEFNLLMAGKRRTKNRKSDPPKRKR